MKKPFLRQKIFTAITFEGVTVRVSRIRAGTEEEAESRLKNAINSRGGFCSLKLDDIMRHDGELSYAVFEADKIKSV